MARLHRLRVAEPGARPRPPAAPPAADPRAGTGRQHSLHRQYAIPEHHPAPPAAGVPGQPRDRTPDQEPDPLERHGDGRARQPGQPGHRWPHLHVRLGGHALGDRLQPLLARAGPRIARRHGLLPGSRLARPVRARVPRGSSRRERPDQLPPRTGPRRRALELPAPVPHVRLLGVPHRQHGPDRDPGDLPRALQPLSRRPRAAEKVGTQGLGAARRRRDGRAGEPRRDHPGLARTARQPHLRHQLQPAAPRRSGARQRQDRAGARKCLPRRRLERHQGALGRRLGCAVRQGQERQAAAADGGMRRRRVPGLQEQERRLRSRALLRQVRRDEGARRRHERRRDLEAHARRPRPAEGVRRVHGGGQTHRPADADPAQDGEGLRHGRIGRRPDDFAPGQEDDGRCVARLSRPLPDSGVG